MYRTGHILTFVCETPPTVQGQDWWTSWRSAQAAWNLQSNTLGSAMRTSNMHWHDNKKAKSQPVETETHTRGIQGNERKQMCSIAQRSTRSIAQRTPQSTTLHNRSSTSKVCPRLNTICRADLGTDQTLYAVGLIETNCRNN